MGIKEMIHISFLAFLILFSGCGGNQSLPSVTPTPNPGSNDPKGETWNVLIYLDGDNNLEQYAIEDMNEMEKVNYTGGKVRVLALFDRIPGESNTNGDWTGTRLYQITQDHDPQVINSSVVTASPWGKIDDSIEADMSDPNTLKEFITYCTNEFPADRTLLVLWNHGGGVWPRSLGSPTNGVDITKGLCWDDTTGDGGWNCLTTDEIREALAAAEVATEKKIDLINIDACLTQTLELAYEIRDHALYLTTSESLVPGYGNDYYRLLSHLAIAPQVSSYDFAKRIVQDYFDTYRNSGYNTTYSALRLAEFTDFIKVFKSFATELKNTTNEEMPFVYQAGFQATRFSWNELMDLYNFAQKLEGINSYAGALRTALNKLIIKNLTTGSFLTTNPAYGLALLLPLNNSKWSYYASENQYPVLSLAKDTDWNEFISKYAAWGSENAN